MDGKYQSLLEEMRRAKEETSRDREKGKQVDEEERYSECEESREEDVHNSETEGTERQRGWRGNRKLKSFRKTGKKRGGSYRHAEDSDGEQPGFAGPYEHVFDPKHPLDHLLEYERKELQVLSARHPEVTLRFFSSIYGNFGESGRNARKT